MNGEGAEPPEGSAQEFGGLVTEVAERDHELTGSLIGQGVGALAEQTLGSPVVGAADLTVHKGAEGEAGEALTLGSDCEGSGLGHLVSVALTLLIYRNQVAVTKWCATCGIGQLRRIPEKKGIGPPSC